MYENICNVTKNSIKNERIFISCMTFIFNYPLAVASDATFPYFFLHNKYDGCKWQLFSLGIGHVHRVKNTLFLART